MGKKSIKRLITYTAIICFVILIAFILNNIFGNPVSKRLSEKATQEYIDVTYPDSDFVIGEVGYDFKNMCYYSKIVSLKDSEIYFYICTDGLGGNLEDYYSDYFDESNGMYIAYYGVSEVKCRYGELKADNRTAEIIIDVFLHKGTKNTKVALKIGEKQIDATRKTDENGEAFYTAVYETDVFTTCYDTDYLNPLIIVTTKNKMVTKPLEKKYADELYALLGDVYLKYLPEVRNRFAEKTENTQKHFFAFSEDVESCDNVFNIENTKISEDYYDVCDRNIGLEVFDIVKGTKETVAVVSLTFDSAWLENKSILEQVELIGNTDDALLFKVYVNCNESQTFLYKFAENELIELTPSGEWYTDAQYIIGKTSTMDAYAEVELYAYNWDGELLYKKEKILATSYVFDGWIYFTEMLEKDTENEFTVYKMKLDSTEKTEHYFVTLPKSSCIVITADKKISYWENGEEILLDLFTLEKIK